MLSSSSLADNGDGWMSCCLSIPMVNFRVKDLIWDSNSFSIILHYSINLKLHNYTRTNNQIIYSRLFDKYYCCNNFSSAFTLTLALFAIIGYACGKQTDHKQWLFLTQNPQNQRFHIFEAGKTKNWLHHLTLPKFSKPIVRSLESSFIDNINKMPAYFRL